MLRGEIRLVDFDPSVGSEANKRRPALIVSNDHANAAAARLGRGVVTVIPLTSSTSRVLPFQVFLPLGGDRLAQGLQGSGGARSIDCCGESRRGCRLVTQWPDEAGQ